MFTFGYLFSRMSWLNKCFHRYFSQYLSLYEVFNVHTVRYTVLCFWPNGDGEIRTLDPLLARQVLSQLSYTPIWILFNSIGLAFKLMGLSGLEPPTSRLSGVRSNRLSYKPISIWQPPAFPYRHQYSIIGRFRLNHRVRDVDGCFPKAHRHQKIVSASQIHKKLLRNSRSLSSFCLITEQWITFTRFP